jgi:hypothetical protein
MRLRPPGATKAKAPDASTGSDDGGAVFRLATVVTSIRGGMTPWPPEAADRQPWTEQLRGERGMSQVIIRGGNLRRHDVDFGKDPISGSIHTGDEVVEIFIEADGEDRPEDRRRFAFVNVPRRLFGSAIAELARQ